MYSYFQKDCQPQLRAVDESTGRGDYTIRAYEELICITEGKQSGIMAGFVQNMMQCDSAIKSWEKESEEMRVTTLWGL